MGHSPRALGHFPIGIIIGSLAPSVQKVGTWACPVLVLVGIFGDSSSRSRICGVGPDGVADVPHLLGRAGDALGVPARRCGGVGDRGSWRTLETVLVLFAWAVAGSLIAPVVVRRMARRQSGQVEAAKERAVQWVR